MGFGRIQLKDINNKIAHITITDIDDMAAVDTVANTILNYTYATQVAAGFGYGINSGVSPSTGDYGSCECKAVMTFRNASISERSKQKITLQFPAPTNSVFERVKDRGFRVTAVIGGAFASLLSGATGDDIQFVRGHIKAKRKQKAV